VTSAIHGSPWLRYGDGTIYRGEQAQEAASSSISMASRSGAELRVYDSTGVLVGLVSSEWGTQILLAAKATVTTSGPGSLSFSLDRRPSWTMTHGTRVDLHLDGSVSPVWSGYLQQVPSALSTAWPYDYEAIGWRAQMSGVIIPSQTYTARRIYQVVRDLVRSQVEPRTDIIYDASLIDSSATYLLGDYRAERATLTSVLDDLRDMAGLYVWGVDADRRFYFQPVSTAVGYHWWVGQHVTDCKAEEESDKLANRIWVKMGKRLPLSDDQWLSYPVEDLASQATYGVREASITAPSVYTESDAARMASVTLAERKAPTVRLSLSGLNYTGPIACEGQARVVSADGTAEETRPIEEVTYDIGPARIDVSVDLGDRRPDVGRWLAGWYGQQERLEQLQQAAQRQTEAAT
jgi:hypothetical protein